MNYTYCSMRDVIGRVVRNLRLEDASYISSAHEWIYEAMEIMEVPQSLRRAWECVSIRFHKAKLPCGLRWIDAVEYNRQRLRWGGGERPPERDLQLASQQDSATPTVFLSTVDKVETVENHFTYETEFTAVSKLPYCRTAYYFTDMGYINTSFEEGKVTIYFHGVAVDKDGMPLIPDNQNFKQALYWYCRSMMIGAGYPDKQFSFDKCFQLFDAVYAPRAIGELTMSTPEQMERRVNNFTRLLPDAGYYDSFFSASQEEQPYYT